MAVHIRLARQGTKKRPFYRVVVTDQRSPRGGRFLESIGTFDPRMDPKAPAKAGKAAPESPLRIDQERLAYWRGTGATPSETLERLLKRASKVETAAVPAK